VPYVILQVPSVSPEFSGQVYSHVLPQNLVSQVEQVPYVPLQVPFPQCWGQVNSQLPPHRPAGQSFSSAPETSETKKNKTTTTTKELVSILVAYFTEYYYLNKIYLDSLVKYLQQPAPVPAVPKFQVSGF
jgi:hypothetical protein